jgi:hypothetical protein
VGRSVSTESYIAELVREMHEDKKCDQPTEGPRVFAAKPTLRSVFAEIDEVVAKVDQALELEKEFAVVSTRDVDDEESACEQPVASTPRDNCDTKIMLGIWLIWLIVLAVIIVQVAPIRMADFLPRNEMGGVQLPAKAPSIRVFSVAIAITSMAMGVVMTMAVAAFVAVDRNQEMLLSSTSPPNRERMDSTTWLVSSLLVGVALSTMNLAALLQNISHA